MALASALAIALAISGCDASPRNPADRFVDGGDGTVRDTHTGLIWAARDQGTLMSWGEAQRYAEGLHLAGHDDWRLPSVAELATLFDEELPGYVPPCTRTQQRVRVPAAIRLSCGVAWSDAHDAMVATHFNLFFGKSFTVDRTDYELESGMALPVRGARWKD